MTGFCSSCSLCCLWLPILLSSVVVFLISWVIHMATPWHKNDFRKVPEEEKLREAFHSLTIPPGNYMVPMASNRKEAGSEEFREKMKKGPVLMMTVAPGGRMSMAKPLIQWFVYLIVVGIFAAYIASRALPAGAGFLPVLRFAGATAFIGYSVALWQTSIWYRRPWTITIKETVDGLIYGIVTGAIFGWLWPC